MRNGTRQEYRNAKRLTERLDVLHSLPVRSRLARKERSNLMRCWLISDTHNRHNELHIPEDLDVVIFCGDESASRNPARNEPQARAFFEWYSALDVSVKIFVLDVLWQMIPDNVDILISHGPPKGYLDVTRDLRLRELIHVGSKSLTQQVKERIKPILHAFGHIHDETGVRNFGIVQEAGITFVNCSCSTRNSRLVNHGIVVEIDPTTRKLNYQSK